MAGRLSALYGALRPADKIPPYRLSMGVNLGDLGPLAAVWRAPLAAVLPIAAGRGVIVDARSSTYAAAWVPQGELSARWVQIRVPGATHLAKHTRGLVARHLCESGVEAKNVKALERVVAQRFKTTLTEPARPGRPWILDASFGTLPHLTPTRPAPSFRLLRRNHRMWPASGRIRWFRGNKMKISAERALQVVNQVADVLKAHRDAQDAVGDAHGEPAL